MREIPTSALRMISESVSWRSEPYAPNKHPHSAASEPESLNALKSPQHTGHTTSEHIFGDITRAENRIVGRLFDRSRTQVPSREDGVAFPPEDPVVKGLAYEFAKRAIDIVLSTMVLAIGLPLLLVISVAIKLTSKGPVLFKQRRLGREQRCVQLL